MITLEGLIKKYAAEEKEQESWNLNPIIGELDDPFNQSQKLLRIPFTEEGNAIVYGVAGSGKTTFLTTMLYHLLSQHTAKTLSTYILDFEAETLRAFAAAPQVGDVLFSSDEEKIENLWKMISQEIQLRKQLFASYGGDMNSYNRDSGQTVSNILIIINNYTSYMENFPDSEEILIRLAREGTKFGIYFILTVTAQNGIRMRMQQNFKQIFLLQLNDKMDYSSVVGNTDGVYPSKYKGRGIIKSDLTYEFQTAYVTEETDRVFEKVMNFCKELKKSSPLWTAKKIPILPEYVTIDFISPAIRDLTKVPIGVDKKNLNVVGYDFMSYVNVVMSNSMTQLSDFMYSLSLVFHQIQQKQQEDRIKIIVLDSIRCCKNRIFDDEIQYVDSEFEEAVVFLFQQLVQRNNTYKDSFGEPLSSQEFERLLYLIPSMNDLMDQLSEDGKDKLRVLLEQGQDDYRVSIIILDDVTSINKYSGMAWYRKQVSSSNGIWLGNGFGNQYLLTVAQSSSELYQEIGDEFGYCIEAGKYTLFKAITSKEEEISEEV